MDKIDEKPKKSNDDISARISKLPAGIVGRFLQSHSVEDRKECEGVSPRCNQLLFKKVWTEKAKLNARIVFAGASKEEIAQFWENSGGHLLVSLVNSARQNLVELDLYSFGAKNLEQFVQQIAESIQHFSKLERLDIRSFNLHDFVDHLPDTLSELKTSYGISVEHLQTLSRRCPNLECVPFKYLRKTGNLNLDTLIELIGKFPRQKRLDFYDFGRGLTSGQPGPPGFYSSIGQLSGLVRLDLCFCFSLDGKSFEAIMEGCQNIVYLSLDVGHLTEQTLFLLANIPKLLSLKLNDPKKQFSDAVLKAIADRGQLKKLWLGLNEAGSPITDAAVEYLLDRCKSLVSLYSLNCELITERSLEAVVAEVNRRHGVPPRSLPSGPGDPGIFYYTDDGTGNDDDEEEEEEDGADEEEEGDENADEEEMDEEDSAEEEEPVGDDNPWLKIDSYDEPKSDEEFDYYHSLF